MWRRTETMPNSEFVKWYLFTLHLVFVYSLRLQWVDTLSDSGELIPRGSASTRTMHNHLPTKRKTIARMLGASNSSHRQDNVLNDNFKCNKWSSFWLNELLRNNILPDFDWRHSRRIRQTQTLEVIQYTNLCGFGCAYGQWPTINVMQIVCEFVAQLTVASRRCNVSDFNFKYFYEREIHGPIPKCRGAWSIHTHYNIHK